MSYRGGDVYSILHLIHKMFQDRAREMDGPDPEIIAMTAAQIAQRIPQPFYTEGYCESGDDRLVRPTASVIARLLTGYAHHFAKEFQVRVVRDRRQRRYCVLRGGVLTEQERPVPLSRYKRAWVI
jgi:hypothetical protein